MFRPTVAYATVNGSTAKLARRVADRLGGGCPPIDVADLDTLDRLADYSHVVLLCPTYGDEELPPPIDAKACACRRFPPHYVVMEAGNYYGYEAYSFGALRMLRHYFEAGGSHAFAPHASIDTMPRVDRATFDRWVSLVAVALDMARMADGGLDRAGAA